MAGKNKRVLLYFCIGFIVVFMLYPAFAGELTHKWKSPSFSGIGASAHFLTIRIKSLLVRLKLKQRESLQQLK